MAEYIERGKAIDACFNGWNNDAHDCAENIRQIPAADVVERKAGRWSSDYIELDGWLKIDGLSCSKCHQFTKLKTPYCPNCGAIMDKEEE